MSGFKYETHFHTDETSPCGKVPAATGVRLYHQAGYSGMIVTDHYFRGFFDAHPFSRWENRIDLFLRGYRNALEEGMRLGLDIQLGMEICFDNDPNDYLVYGIDEDFLKYNKKLYRLDLRRFREMTKGFGIAIVQAHPFRPGQIPADPELIDGIEVYNANPRHDSRNDLALEYAQDNGLKMISGSDFHRIGDEAGGGVLVGDRHMPDGFAGVLLRGGITGLIRAR
jgi:predicted metal-dependent phosphoesterase TrpH